MLSLPQTGTVTIPGAVTLQEDSMLEFHVDGTDSALLTLSSAPALPESGKVTVKLTADSLPKVGSSYTLTSGAGLADGDASKFKLADEVQGNLSVNDDGELVYTAPEYFYIKVADSDLPVPMQWIVDNGAATTRDSIQSVADALAKPGENGIPVWQSYCLGLEPNEASSVVLCEAAANQSDPGRVAIKAANINIPEGLKGVEVLATLERKIPGEEFTAVTNATFASGAIVLTTPEIGPGLSFFA